MADLDWTAKGIAEAEAAGGLTLERYTRPGFTGGPAVRVARTTDAIGYEADLDTEDTDTEEASPC